jgi:arylsulfatase A-like enzyme
MYRYSDRALGRILSEMPAQVGVAIVSDHGTEKASSQNEVFFAVNTENLLRDLGLEGRLFIHTLNNNQFVYPVSETDRDSFPGFLEERLSRLEFENGKRLFRLAQSEVGDYYIVNDHLAGERSRLRLEGRPIELSRYVEESFTLSGAHSLYGTAIFRGANVKRGEVISGARIHDIAPTVLHWAGLPVGRDMEGKVLRDIFEGDREVAFVPHYRYPNAIDSSAPVLDDATKERLEAMGYVQ